LTAGARSIARSASATASSLVAAWPVTEWFHERERPFPEVPPDALNYAEFYFSIFHR
jgi:hypothetical protein